MHESPVYAAIDLHSTNSYLAILDSADNTVYDRRLRNRPGEILAALEPCRDRVHAVAVESTFNWYWLVDGLMAWIEAANFAVRYYEQARGSSGEPHRSFSITNPNSAIDTARINRPGPPTAGTVGTATMDRLSW